MIRNILRLTDNIFVKSSTKFIKFSTITKYNNQRNFSQIAENQIPENLKNGLPSAAVILKSIETKFNGRQIIEELKKLSSKQYSFRSDSAIEKKYLNTLVDKIFNKIKPIYPSMSLQDFIHFLRFLSKGMLYDFSLSPIDKLEIHKSLYELLKIKNSKSSYFDICILIHTLLLFHFKDGVPMEILCQKFIDQAENYEYSNIKVKIAILISQKKNPSKHLISVKDIIKNGFLSEKYQGIFPSETQFLNYIAWTEPDKATNFLRSIKLPSDAFTRFTVNEILQAHIPLSIPSSPLLEGALKFALNPEHSGNLKLLSYNSLILLNKLKNIPISEEVINSCISKVFHNVKPHKKNPEIFLNVVECLLKEKHDLSMNCVEEISPFLRTEDECSRLHDFLLEIYKNPQIVYEKLKKSCTNVAKVNNRLIDKFLFIKFREKRYFKNKEEKKIELGIQKEQLYHIKNYHELAELSLKPELREEAFKAFDSLIKENLSSIERGQQIINANEDLSLDTDLRIILNNNISNLEDGYFAKNFNLLDISRMIKRKKLNLKKIEKISSKYLELNYEPQRTEIDFIFDIIGSLIAKYYENSQIFLNIIDNFTKILFKIKNPQIIYDFRFYLKSIIDCPTRFLISDFLKNQLSSLSSILQQEILLTTIINLNSNLNLNSKSIDDNEQLIQSIIGYLKSQAEVSNNYTLHDLNFLSTLAQNNYQKIYISDWEIFISQQLNDPNNLEAKVLSLFSIINVLRKSNLNHLFCEKLNEVLIENNSNIHEFYENLIFDINFSKSPNLLLISEIDKIISNSISDKYYDISTLFKIYMAVSQSSIEFTNTMQQIESILRHSFDVSSLIIFFFNNNFVNFYEYFNLFSEETKVKILDKLVNFKYNKHFNKIPNFFEVLDSAQLKSEKNIEYLSKILNQIESYDNNKKFFDLQNKIRTYFENNTSVAMMFSALLTKINLDPNLLKMWEAKLKRIILDDSKILNNLIRTYFSIKDQHNSEKQQNQVECKFINYNLAKKYYELKEILKIVNVPFQNLNLTEFIINFPIFIPAIQSILLIENDNLNSEILSQILFLLNVKYIGIPEKIFTKSNSLKLIINLLKSKGIVAENFPTYTLPDKIILKPLISLNKDSKEQNILNSNLNSNNLKVDDNYKSFNKSQQKHETHNDSHSENSEESLLKYTPIFLSMSNYIPFVSKKL